MPTGDANAAKRRKAFIENESLPADNSDSHLFERDIDKVGPEKIEFQTQNKVPGIDSSIDKDDHSYRSPIMGSTREAKSSLDLLGVKDKKVKQPFNTEENRAMTDRSPGDSLYGDDKETQGRHITNMKGPGGLKTGMVKRASLSVGDDILVGQSTYKVAEIKSNGVIARHAFTSTDHFFDQPVFNRIATAAFKQSDVKVVEASKDPLFFEGKAEDGLFPIGEDDTIPK